MKRCLVPVLVALLLLSLVISGAAAADSGSETPVVNTATLPWEQQSQNNSSDGLLQNRNRQCPFDNGTWCYYPAPEERELARQRLRDGSCLDPEFWERAEAGKPVRQQLRDGSCGNALGQNNLSGSRPGQGRQKRLGDESCWESEL